MTEAVGAGSGERTTDRVGYRSGYYSRGLVTRIGKLELRVPRDREGRFSISRKIKTSFLRCLGPRCSRRRTCGRTGQQRNDLDAGTSVEISTTNYSACAVPPTHESRPDERRDRPPPLARIFAKFDFGFFGRPPMNIDEKCSTPATPIQIWPETTLISRKTIPKRTLRRWRAEARARWPMYLADVAYRIERLPQPKRRHGRTWAEVARDNFLAPVLGGSQIRGDRDRRRSGSRPAPRGRRCCCGSRWPRGCPFLALARSSACSCPFRAPPGVARFPVRRPQVSGYNPATALETESLTDPRPDRSDPATDSALELFYQQPNKAGS